MFDNIKKAFGKESDIDTYKNNEHDERVRLWRSLYKGYCPKIHDVKYMANNMPKTRQLKSLKLPKVISEDLAKLILNEKLELNFDKDSTWDIISETLKHNNFRKNMQENIEMMFAMGGLAIECYFNADNEQIELNYIHAQNFRPMSWTSGKEILEAQLIVETIEEGGKTYSLVRVHHFPNNIYTITNELYVKNAGESGLGKKIPLDKKYPNLEENIFFNGETKPFFAYCKPSISNNFDLDSPLGISVFANAIDTLQVLDKEFDSLDREIELGKRRILVPAPFIKVDETHEAYFDIEDEVFQGMNGTQGDDWTITDIAPQLRIQEHIDAINQNLQILCLQTGLSPGTYSFDATGLKTATEVISENSRTFKTKKSHENNIDHLIRKIVDIIFRLGNLVGKFGEVGDYQLEINYDDSIIEDINTTISQQILMVGQGLQSKVAAMMVIHKITEEEAKKKLQEIESEKETVPDDVIDMLGN